MHRDSWKPLKAKHKDVEIIGWDTETKPNGDTFLLTKSDINGDYSFDVRDFNEFLNLTWNQRTRSAVNFFFNLNFDFASLVKYTGKDCLEDLAQNGICIFEDWIMKWIPGKAWTLSKRDSQKFKKGSLKFFDIAQFYNTSLKKAAPLVGEEKLEFETSKIDYNLYLTNDEYRDNLVKYAKVDARICRKLGERLFRAVNTIVPVREFYSTASIAQTYFLSQLTEKLRMAPNKVLEYALNSYGGGRFELVKRGHFDKVYEIDINSAYPKEMSMLVATDTPTGKWEFIEDGGSFNPNSIYGFYEVSCKTYDYILSPLIYRDKMLLTYPHGKHKTFIELSELKVIEKLGFPYRIHGGYEYHDTNPTYPFNFINRLYQERTRLKNEGKDDLQYVYKIIMNSAYGKTIQMVANKELHDTVPMELQNPELFDLIDVDEIDGPNGEVLTIITNGYAAGRMFNPVFAAAITARTRAKLLDTVIDNRLEDSLIGFATDCLFLKTKPPARLVEHNNFGDWKLEVNGAEGLFIGSGVYALRSEKKQINHIRGFRSKRDLFSDIIEKYIVTPDEEGIAFESISPVKLKEGIRGGIRTTPNGEINVSWTDIGKFIETRKILDINFDKKRKWDRMAEGPMDLLENEIGSVPLVI